TLSLRVAEDPTHQVGRWTAGRRAARRTGRDRRPGYGWTAGWHRPGGGAPADPAPAGNPPAAPPARSRRASVAARRNQGTAPRAARALALPPDGTVTRAADSVVRRRPRARRRRHRAPAPSGGDALPRCPARRHDAESDARCRAAAPFDARSRDRAAATGRARPREPVPSAR